MLDKNGHLIRDQHSRIIYGSCTLRPISTRRGGGPDEFLLFGTEILGGNSLATSPKGLPFPERPLAGLGEKIP